MLNLLVSWMLMAVAVYLTALLVPGFRVKSFGAAVTVSAVYGILNVLLYKLLFILVFPVAILTLGLIVNMILLWVTAKATEKVEISGVLPLFGAALSISLIRFVLHWALGAS